MADELEPLDREAISLAALELLPFFSDDGGSLYDSLLEVGGRRLFDESPLSDRLAFGFKFIAARAILELSQATGETPIEILGSYGLNVQG